jgi:hypothetical protein
MSVGGLPCHPSIVRRIILIAVVVALVGTACGETGLLDGLGDRTREVVQGETTTTSLVVAVAAGIDEALVPSTDVLWFNDDIAPQFSGPSVEVIEAVWTRQRSSRFVQAARLEIASALPSLAFPGQVPAQVRWITSQLVYDESTGGLGADTSAAFGMWTDEPYQSDTARLGVLRVGRAPIEAPAIRSTVTSIEVPDGVSLSWTESGHRYELFCQSQVSEALCVEIALSTVPLLDLRP